MFLAYSRDNAVPYLNLLGILTLENVYNVKVAFFTQNYKQCNLSRYDIQMNPYSAGLWIS